MSNMINRNKSKLPKNYHLSIAKMIDDVFVAGFADLYEGFTELDPIISRQFHVKKTFDNPIFSNVIRQRLHSMNPAFLISWKQFDF